MRKLRDISRDDLRAVIGTVLQESGGHMEGAFLPRACAEMLGSSTADPDGVGHPANHYREFGGEVRRFANRVRGAADSLAAEGQLIKIGRGQAMPGRHTTYETHYFTLARYEQSLAAQREREQRQAAESIRWDSIRRRLHQAGFEPLRLDKRDTRISLSADDWEGLLDRLERAHDLLGEGL